MQLILSNADLTAAITAYLGSVVTVNETATVQVELTEDGAVVEITPAGQAPAPKPEPRVVKTRGPRKAQVADGKLTVAEGAVVETPVVEKSTPPAGAVERMTPTVTPSEPSPGVTSGGVANPLPGDPDMQEPEPEQEEDLVQEPTPEQKPVNKATSLFAGLNRPKN